MRAYVKRLPEGVIIVSTRRSARSMRVRGRSRSHDAQFFLTDDGKGLVRDRSSVALVGRTWPVPPGAPAADRVFYARSPRDPQSSTAASLELDQICSFTSDLRAAFAKNIMRDPAEQCSTDPDGDACKFVKTVVDLHILTARLPATCPDEAARDDLQSAMALWLSYFPLKRSFDGLLDLWSSQCPARDGEEDAAAQYSTVELDSPTGPAEYRLPFRLDETYGPTEVGEILSPTGTPNRTAAKVRRDKSELLGVEVGHGYRYPKFQLDVAKHCVRPVVAYANVQLDSAQDPWGVLTWWYSIDSALGDRPPVELAAAGELTREHVDLTVGIDGRGMS
ncbi:hypothetical protein [Rhodococcus sp. BS-15]|uniref:hypothetical protein n=1 Tax=Rhodococcus sp. BS-15 TaxID=1304954 RepID=UPI000AD0F08D|nr:hypothetical protein [Rhodococcus sp. BS-15]